MQAVAIMRMKCCRPKMKTEAEPQPVQPVQPVLPDNKTFTA